MSTRKLLIEFLQEKRKVKDTGNGYAYDFYINMTLKEVEQFKATFNFATSQEVYNYLADISENLWNEEN